jgi:phosphopantothenoylcysteine decarboxylase
MKILIGITGSVAGKLTPKLHKMLTQRGHEVRLVFTQKGKFFVDKNFLFFVPMLNNKNIIWFDESSEFFGATYDDNLRIIKHIELRDWADVFLICPCSANTMSKISVGICDNLLTSIFRAWDFNKPIFIAPAMNTKMWEHPVTGNSLKIIESWGVRVIQPVVKKLACGETGVGALADLDFIVKEIEGY